MMGVAGLKCVAQTYDGATVMSGSKGGVQHPEAIDVHCYAHKLNLYNSQTLTGDASCGPEMQSWTLTAICDCLSAIGSPMAVGLRAKLHHFSIVYFLLMFQSQFLSVTEGRHKFLQKERLQTWQKLVSANKLYVTH
jgi:hypothetical protein